MCRYILYARAQGTGKAGALLVRENNMPPEYHSGGIDIGG